MVEELKPEDWEFEKVNFGNLGFTLCVFLLLEVTKHSFCLSSHNYLGTSKTWDAMVAWGRCD